MIRPVVAALLAGVSLAACTLAPPYERTVLPISPTWPVAGATAPGGETAADYDWRQVFQDQKLQGVIDLALRQNRDLRVAVANIERARSLYGVQRSALLPSIAASLSQSRVRTAASVSQTGADIDSDQYSASIGFTGYELDLFGRVRSLNAAALQTFFATEENQRSVQISLIAEVAADYLNLAADQDLLAVTQDTLKSREAALTLAQRRFDAGATSGLDLRQVETLAEQARSDAAAAAARVLQDRNALQLVVGAEVPAALLPDGGLAAIAVLEELPPGVPSEVLARRPDVLAAEHNLIGQNANIGAARAAFFPRISLTAQAGSASPELDGLFSGGTGGWSFLPQITLPIFTGGANRANLGVANANRDIALAQYEKAVQSAFRDVADALAVRSTIRERVGSQTRLVAAATDAQRLTQARYDRGVDSYLALLDAQRTLYDARRGLVAVQLTDIANRVELYKALGGGAPIQP